MKSHSEETMHKCLTCGKCFRQRDVLTVHLRIHTGECIHTDEWNALTYVRCMTNLLRKKGNLSRHMASHENQFMPESHNSELKEPKLISSSCESHLLTVVSDGAKEEGFSSDRSVLTEQNSHLFTHRKLHTLCM